MKIIVVESHLQYPGDEPELTTQVYDSPAQFLATLQPHEKLVLAQSGWRNIKEIQDKVEKAALEQEFFIAGSGGYLRQVQLDQLSSNDHNALCYGGVLVQKVNPSTILPAVELKRYNTSQNKIKSEAKRKADAAKARKKKIVEKQLEKARKLLEKHEVKNQL